MGRRRFSTRGTVVELDWDGDGEVVAWAVETDRETYELADSPKARKLIGFVGGRVTVSGWVTEDDDDETMPLLDVDAYEVVSMFYDEDDDDKDDDEPKSGGEQSDADELEAVDRRRAAIEAGRDARRAI